MTEVFDTYTEKTKAYYIMLLILIIPILFLALTDIFSSLQLSQEQTRYLGAFCCFVLAIYIALKNSFIKMYVKDGEISFSNTSIKVNSVIIQLNQINKIVIKANDYKGNQKGTSDGSGNRIEIYDQTDKLHIYRFVVKSYFDLNDLKKILAHYTENGLIVTSNGF